MSTITDDVTTLRIELFSLADRMLTELSSQGIEIDASVLRDISELAAQKMSAEIYELSDA